MTFLWILFTAGGFLFGSVLFSKIIPKFVAKKDVTLLSSDGNPGSANVFINCGVILGFLCLFLDMLKGFLPVFLGVYFLDTGSSLFSLVILSPALGHGLGIFNKFHGGKCIATIFGTMIGLLPISRIGLVLAVLYIVFSTVIKISPNSKRSIVTFSLFIIISLAILIPMKRYYIALGCFVSSAIAIIKHVVSPNESVKSINTAEVYPDEKKEKAYR